jgi:hypothetical protein
MKYSLLVFAFFLIALNCSAQSLVGQKRKFIYPATLSVCAYDGTTTKETQLVFQDMNFTIVNQPAGGAGYVIMIGEFDPKKDANSYNLYNFRGSSQVYFLINTVAIDNISQQIFPEFSPQFGAISFPFKYRPQSGVFEPTFSLSAAGGVRYDRKQENNFTWLGLIGIGASSVQVDPSNSQATASSQLAAVTLSLSIMAQWKTVQFGISSGIDNILSGNSEKWVSQGKPWLSIGVGLTIFSNNTSGSASTTNTETNTIKANSEAALKALRPQ